MALDTNTFANLERDISDVDKTLNTKTVVKPRYGNAFKSLPLAIQEVIETGGFEPFATEAELLASVPTLTKKAAKALDTKKIWLWKQTSAVGVIPVKYEWVDTGLSELQLAENFAKNLIADKIETSGDVASLFNFNDAEDKTVVQIRGNGDIVNPNYSLNEIGQLGEQTASKVGNKLDILEEVNTKEELFNFIDNLGRTVVSFLENGDIVFAGGRSLLGELDAKKIETKQSFSSKEFVSSEFLAVMQQGQILNGASSIGVFLSATKQDYQIKNTQDFLALKISEPANHIKIETPYFDTALDQSPYSQVVHPFLCEFKKSQQGFKYILLLTPFHKTNDQYENPVVYGSNDLKVFKMLDGFKQPLAEPLKISNYNYNSDNFAVFDHTTGEFCVFYRNTIANDSNTQIIKNNLYVRRTSDFVNWTESKLIKNANNQELLGALLSPSVIFNPTLKKWMMYSVDWTEGAIGGEYCYRTSDHLEYGWSEPIKVTSPIQFKPWHQETRYCGKNFISIINDIDSKNANNGNGDLHIGISSDGINWQFSNSMFDGAFKDPYKASISPVFNENKVKFNILWTSNGNFDVNGWKLFATETSEIEVI